MSYSEIMKVKELIKKLEKLDPEAELLINAKMPKKYEKMFNGFWDAKIKNPITFKNDSRSEIDDSAVWMYVNVDLMEML